MTFPRGLRALNHRDFRRFFLAQLVAQSGTWMQTVAQSWLVLQLTDSPLKLGLIGTLQFAPMLLFSIATGALADRVPKRRLLVGTQAALACQALALALLVASGHVQYWHVAVLGFFTGLANVMDQPARQSFVAELVGKNDTSLQLEAPDALRGRVMSLYTLVWGGVFPSLLARERNLYVSLTCHLRPVSDAGQDIGLVEARVLVQDLWNRPPGGEKIQNQGHPDPVSANARLPEAHLRVDGDPRQQLLFGHRGPRIRTVTAR